MLHSREPETPLAAVGFSLGGKCTIEMVRRNRGAKSFKSRHCTPVPFDLEKSVKRINQGFSRIYQSHLLKCLQRKLESKREANVLKVSFPSLDKIHTIRDFDDQVTAPLHGFISAEDYYTQCSSRQFLHAIRVPTLLIHAKDDPFMTDDIIPEPYELSNQVTLGIDRKRWSCRFCFRFFSLASRLLARKTRTFIFRELF